MSFGKHVSEFESASAVPSIQTVRHERSPVFADDVDFEVHGTETQFVEIELDPGESAIAEAGSMMFKHPSIDMITVFGDGSEKIRNTGFLDKLIGAGKRLISGESLFTTVFTHNGHGKARVSFAAPYPGNVIPLRLDEVGNMLLCQKDAFLCAAKGVSLGIAFQRKIMTGLFGGEGFVMQKLEGDGWVFVHAGGSVIEKNLAAGEEIHIDTGCVEAYTGGIDFDIIRVGSVKSMLFGGEGIFFAKLRGPGRVWIQTLPFSRLAGRILVSAPQTGGPSQSKGSSVGDFSNFLNGND